MITPPGMKQSSIQPACVKAEMGDLSAFNSASTPGSRTSAHAFFSVTPRSRSARAHARLQRIGEFIFAAWRFLEPRRVGEDARREEIDAGIIIGVGRNFAQRAFLHQVAHETLVVENDRAALGQVLAVLHRDDAVLLEGLDQAPVIGRRTEQDVAVGQEKFFGTDPFLRRVGRFAGAVLHLLFAVGNAYAPARAVAEVFADDLAVPAYDDEKIADRRLVAQPLDDVLEHRLALDAHHRLGEPGGEVAHPGSFPGRQNDCFHTALM